MILSQTYYCLAKGENGINDKLFLQVGIQNHSVWRSSEFWQKAIEKGLQEDMPEKEKDHIETPEEAMVRQNIAFGKLGTFAHNMLQFGINRTATEHIIFPHVVQQGLSPSFVKALKVTQSIQA
jgi:hypothetical protein